MDDAIYIMTFGAFLGLSAQFGAADGRRLYGSGNTDIVAGSSACADSWSAATPSPTRRPSSSSARSSAPVRACCSRRSPMRWVAPGGRSSRRMGLIASIIYDRRRRTPPRPRRSRASPPGSSWACSVIFLFSGIGNACSSSRFDDLRAAPGRRRDQVVDWRPSRPSVRSSSLPRCRHAAARPLFYWVGGLAWAVMCAVIVWMRYARPRPSPS